ncbi:hypothetical protein GRJ2_000706000 [Grus japonensis]|uniref:Uncharacterized protein n=1 Tax=Grus japonensis TaxID=30415 RepID=A0ABC9WDU1_GRUJA
MLNEERRGEERRGEERRGEERRGEERRGEERREEKRREEKRREEKRREEKRREEKRREEKRREEKRREEKRREEKRREEDSSMNTKAREEGGEEALQVLEQGFLGSPWNSPHWSRDLNCGLGRPHAGASFFPVGVWLLEGLTLEQRKNVRWKEKLRGSVMG